LIGYYHGKGEFFTIRLIPEREIFLPFFLYSLVGGGIYIVNQIFDKETDHLNRKLFIIADGHMSVKTAWLYTMFLYVTALTVSWFISMEFFLIVILSIILGFLYSVRPFHFKGRPVIDIISNSIGNGVLNFYAGYVIVSSIKFEGLLSTIPYQLAIGAVYLTTTVADIPGDRAAGDRTSGVVFGEKITGILAFILLFLSVITAFWLWDLLALLPGFLSLPFFFYLIFKPIVPMFIKASRVCTALMALAAGILFPWFAVFVICVVIFSKWYYKTRFHLNYPKIFSGSNNES